ncbi:MAG: thioredoxin domain-containing protein [Chloroflexi bacterium]|nr:thioredoxin domain-containing protein [Chloroflexota bacterium]
MPNHLIHETSPYLLQHAHNPVDWYPWGQEALARARAENKPILLSIGYSACHWCHVMERESFENEATAALMNLHYVNIKVDREERPDLDAIYMTAVQGLTGGGGWPMTVFLTPDARPFYGGTYFPPEDRGPSPGFKRVLLAISDAYQSRHDEVVKQADVVASFIRQQTVVGLPADLLSSTVLDSAVATLANQFDRAFGGFGAAPKFPQAMALDFLLRYHQASSAPTALDLVETSLRRMAAGGIYDQVGGGFHRYSVDARWLVPHFEKMLYDNALLAQVYTHGYLVTGDPLYREIATGILDYVLREMRSPGGGFFSAQDADSEGEEGAYYLWTPEQVAVAVGLADAELICSYFGVTVAGHLEGKSICTSPADRAAFAAQHGMTPPELEEKVGAVRTLLMKSRSRRVPPSTDDKILCGWNGLMLTALAEASNALGQPEYLAAAKANADFLLRELWSDGKLHRVHREHAPPLEGYLEDYAALVNGLISLYEASFELNWFIAAKEISGVMVTKFWDPTDRTFRDTALGAEALIARPKERWDNATPSGTSLACRALLRIWALTGEPTAEELARVELARSVELMADHPTGVGNMLSALHFYLGPPDEIAIIGEPAAADTRLLIDSLSRHFLPHAVIACATAGDSDAMRAIPLLADRPSLNGKATAYVCRGFTCDLPTTVPEQVLTQLGVRGPRTRTDEVSPTNGLS